MVPAPVACFACYILIVYEIDRKIRSISLAHIPEREPLSGILNNHKKFKKGVGQWVIKPGSRARPCARRVGVFFSHFYVAQKKLGQRFFYKI